jgi:hypothetical protein
VPLKRKYRYVERRLCLFDNLGTFNLPTTTIVAQPFNGIKWQLKFNPAAEGLTKNKISLY